VEEEPPQPERKPIELLQREWIVRVAKSATPEERALARSIREEEWDYLRRMNDRIVEDYGAFEGAGVQAGETGHS
jgi:hypothetical protein